ncbi:T19E23.5 [Arabidopsis thaliana]|uniref:T19E23.5 n=1 Tax=Arabidopsis thaliana TaxID=3702 RepID=Q9SHF5_ARATH|nr:T19E23.5 [Arabidopsis thaliana]
MIDSKEGANIECIDQKGLSIKCPPNLSLSMLDSEEGVLNQEYMDGTKEYKRKCHCKCHKHRPPTHSPSMIDSEVDVNKKHKKKCHCKCHKAKAPK